MASDRSSDQPGVLGSLPRSRPGRRSDKRSADSGETAGGADTTAGGGRSAKRSSGGGRSAKGGAGSRTKGATRSTRASAAATRAKRAGGGTRKGSGSRSGGRSPKQSGVRGEVSPAQRSSGGHGDPITGAIKLAGKVLGAGVRTAGEVVRRLPGR